VCGRFGRSRFLIANRLVCQVDNERHARLAARLACLPWWQGLVTVNRDKVNRTARA